MRRTWSLSLVLYCLTCGAVLAQSPEKPLRRIAFPGLELSLGMKREDVIASLSKSYKVSESGNGAWTVLGKEGPPFEYLGTVEFKDGRLSAVSKSWGSFSGDEAFKLGQEMLTALQGITESRVAPVIVRLREVRQPGFRADVIDLLFDARTLSITVVDTAPEKGGRQVSISERLSEE